MVCGDLRLVPLGEGETAVVTIEPERGFDCGEGPGKRVEREARGGTVGVILDARGRPLEVPTARDTGRKAVEQWVTALDLYPDLAPTPARQS